MKTTRTSFDIDNGVLERCHTQEVEIVHTVLVHGSIANDIIY